MKKSTRKGWQARALTKNKQLNYNAGKGERQLKKFELTSDFITNTFGVKLFRIKALVEFGNVKAGELGGYIEKEENLNQYGDAWVYGNAKVYGDAEVYGDAKVCGDAWVYGDAKVYGDAWVYGDAKVYGNADYVTVKGFGSVFRTTSFFREKNKSIGVKCGCFYGELDEFRDKVKETHGESKTAKEYLMLADLIEYKFSEEIAAERK